MLPRKSRPLIASHDSDGRLSANPALSLAGTFVYLCVRSKVRFHLQPVKSVDSCEVSTASRIT